MKNKRREKKCDRRKLVGIGVVYSVYILYLLYHSCNSSGLFVSYFPALLFIMLAASEINITYLQYTYSKSITCLLSMYKSYIYHIYIICHISISSKILQFPKKFITKLDIIAIYRGAIGPKNLFKH